MSTSIFHMNLTPKDKDDINNYKNFMYGDKFDMKNYNGKIVYNNYCHPDKHIFTPYYIINEVAYALSYTEDSNSRKQPLFTMQDLEYTDYIVFYTAEQVKIAKRC